jgi:hypothetical protein
MTVKSAAAIALGKLGGRSRSDRKRLASARNGAFGGRPPLGLSRDEWQTFCAKCGARDPRQVAKELLLSYRE